MFLPSEAVYAELHARLPEVVRAGFNKNIDARVWIVSPTTCHGDAQHHAGGDRRTRVCANRRARSRRVARQLHRDVGLIEERAGKLETHIRQAGEMWRAF